MADEQVKPADAPAKKRLPMKMIIVVAVVMIVEGALFGAGIMLFGDSPPAVEASTLEDDQKAKEQDLVEVLLVGGKFQNTRQGAQAYMYQTSIYVLVKQKDQAYVEEQIKAEINRITDEIIEVFARAEPAELSAPERLELKRKIMAKCNERFKVDADGKPYIHGVVMSGWMRISSDL